MLNIIINMNLMRSCSMNIGGENIYIYKSIYISLYIDIDIYAYTCIYISIYIYHIYISIYIYSDIDIFFKMLRRGVRFS